MWWKIIGVLAVMYAAGMGGKAFISWYDRNHPDNFPPMTGE